MDLGLELFVDGEWRNAATLSLTGDSHTSSSELSYEPDYVVARDPKGTGEVVGLTALSVRLPLNFEWRDAGTWPSFVLDLLPQGHARTVLARGMQLDPALDTSDLPLLVRAGGGPIGNLRVTQAALQERERLAPETFDARLELDDVFQRSERFLHVTETFGALVASGSTGVQGAWPKMLLTKSRDEGWYPDPLVSDADAVDHAILKWVGDKASETSLIIEAEASYLEVARWFGVRCARPSIHRNGSLLIPRFDRRIDGNRVIRLGQESLVSAAGFAEFGHVDAHETYLDVLRTFSSQAAADITEYVLRDLLNLAMGNPDNHGRNTALQKEVDGSIRLSPLFDFCPMRLDRTGVRRSTKWRCMERPGGGSDDLDPDWNVVCEVAAAGTFPSDDLRAVLASKTELLSELPNIARHLGVPGEVVDYALGRCQELSRAVASIRRQSYGT